MERSQDVLLQTNEGKSFVFTPQDKWNSSKSTYLSLDSALLRSIIQQIPTLSPEELVPTVFLTGIPETLRGLWSLWRVSVRSADWSAQRLLPLFLNEQGRSFLPTGRSLWELLLEQEIRVEGYLDQPTSISAFNQCQTAAESLGKGLFVELSQVHRQGLELDRQKGEYAFQVRRRMIERVGLPAVRAHRLVLLAQEQQSWAVEIDRRACHPTRVDRTINSKGSSSTGVIGETCMGNWRETILKEFTPQVARITLVADPDTLLSEEVIIQEIQSRGFDFVIYEEPISFRYLYKSKYQPIWEAGDPKEIIILLHSEDDSFGQLPYDIFSGARRLKFGLDRIFPNLHRGVLSALDRSLLDDLFQAQIIYAPHQLSENATKDFILRHVFEIAPEMIKTPADLLRNLLRKHYREQNFPAIFDDWLVQMLRKTNRFMDWPLEILSQIVKHFLHFYRNGGRLT